MEKSKSITLLLSFIPGAGHMYLGLMKKGAFFMLSCVLINSLSHILHFGSIGLVIPVIWFFSLFDAFHLWALTPEQRALTELAFSNKLDDFFQRDWKNVFIKYRIYIGLFIILIGLNCIFSNFVLPYIRIFDDYYGWFYNFFYNIPEAILSIVFILGGLYLLKDWKNNKK